MPIPFPSLVVPRKRKHAIRLEATTDGTGQTDGKVVRVPLGDSAQDFFVRCHELGHLRWTDFSKTPSDRAREWDVAVSTVQYAEDYRIGRLLLEAGVPIQDTPSFIPANHVRSFADAIPAYFAQVGYAAVERETLRQMYPKLAEIEAEIADVDWHESDSAKMLAQAVTRAMEREVEWEHAESDADDASDGGDGQSTTPVQAYKDVARYRLDGGLEHVERVKRYRYIVQDEKTQKAAAECIRLLKAPSYSDANASESDVRRTLGMSLESFGRTIVPSGTMATVTARLTQRVGTVQLRGTKVATRMVNTGQRVRRASRMLTDGKVFVRRTMGGTILIDCSGSMYLTHETIVDLLRARPAATIAVYCSANCRTGFLTIIAQKGRAVSLEDFHNVYLGGGNVIDLPALEWLARQSGPRVWICDGCVTGVNDDVGPNIARACASIVLQNRITRIGSLGKFLETDPRSVI
jgi:hypothetical protein